jgi:hypothetical protein
MKKTKQKFRIGITVAEHYKNGEVVKTSRQVPARIREIIRKSNAEKWEVTITYAPNKTNAFVRDTKEEVLEGLLIFLDKDLVRSIIDDK